jgi:hypothetical protein
LAIDYLSLSQAPDIAYPPIPDQPATLFLCASFRRIQTCPAAFLFSLRYPKKPIKVQCGHPHP